MLKSLCDLPCVILCVMEVELLSELSWYFIKEEGTEEAVGVGGSRSRMTDCGMFSSLHLSAALAVCEGTMVWTMSMCI